MQPSGGGLGNRELVSVAGMALAIATNRVALVDWYGVTDKDISDIHQVYESPSGLLLSYPAARALHPDWDGWRSEKLMIFDSTNAYNEKWGLEEIVCGHIEEEKYTVLRIITEQYITSLVERNAYIGNILADIQPALYQQLSSAFVRPIDVIMQRVDKFAQDHFTGKYVIGMQIRRARDSGHFFLWDDQHLFWDCARLMKKRKERDLAREKSDEKVVFFLATDSELVKQEAMKELGPDVLTVDIATRVPDTRGTEGWENALVDNYLLSHADDLIVSGGSTFGYVAHGRSDIIPLVVSGIHHRCMRPITAEPYNIAYLAIKKVSCFDESNMLLPETDMICSSVDSVHSCASHSSEKMAKKHKAQKEPHFNLGSEENMPKLYNAALKKLRQTTASEAEVKDHLQRALAHLKDNKNVKARKTYAKAAVLAVANDFAKWAGRAFYGLAGAHLLRSNESHQPKNEDLHEAMKALYQGLLYLPYQVEANILMGNYMEIWGGTPRAHVGVQFYRRAMWCLESAIFEEDGDIDLGGGGGEDDAFQETTHSNGRRGADASEGGHDDDDNHDFEHDDKEHGYSRDIIASHYLPFESCSLMFQTLDQLPEALDLDALLLTTYVHIQRALKKSGRDAEAARMEDIMEDSLDDEKLALRSKVGGMLNHELIRLMSGAVDLQ